MAAATVPSSIVWVTLGTGGGPIVRADRFQSSNALTIGGDVVLFDAGDGVVRGLARVGIPLGRVRAVVLSHLHPDHTSGLAALIALRWQNGIASPLAVYGPAGTRELVDGILASNRPAERIGLASPGIEPAPAGRSITTTEIGCAGETIVIGAASVTAIGNTHYAAQDGGEPVGERSCSFRIGVAGRNIVYTGDTGPSEAVTRLARGADLLVSEVADPGATLAAVSRGPVPLAPAVRDGLAFHLTHHHLTPDELGRMAAAARPKAVVLTHISPGLDGESGTAGYSDGVRRLYPGPVTVAVDGQRFVVPPGS